VWLFTKFNNDVNKAGGLIKIEELVSKLNTLEKDLNSLLILGDLKLNVKQFV